MITTWYNGLFFLVLTCTGFFALAIFAAKSVNATDFSITSYVSNAVVWITDVFFDSIVRMHVHSALEWVSSLGLLALLAGKITGALLFEGAITVRTSWLVGAMLFGGLYQMFAVVKRRNIKTRMEASTFATGVWLFVFVSLFVGYIGEMTIIARVIFELVLPLCLVFVLLSVVQTLVLMRECMHPSLSREEAFAMAIFTELQRVFKLDESLRADFYQIVHHIAKKFELRK
jgi:hypothetical protein